MFWVFFTVLSSQSRYDPVVSKHPNSSFPILIQSNKEHCAALLPNCKPELWGSATCEAVGGSLLSMLLWSCAGQEQPFWAVLGCGQPQGSSPCDFTWSFSSNSGCVDNIHFSVFWMSLRILNMGIISSKGSCRWRRAGNFLCLPSAAAASLGCPAP